MVDIFFDYYIPAFQISGFEIFIGAVRSFHFYRLTIEFLVIIQVLQAFSDNSVPFIGPRFNIRQQRLEDIFLRRPVD